MRESSIPQHRLRRLSFGVPPEWRGRIGHELRERRVTAGLSQAELGSPLTRAYVSAVERGRVVPSLPALRLMTRRLDTTLADFFAGVEHRDPAVER